MCGGSNFCCIFWSFVCDGFGDCDDGFDEFESVCGRWRKGCVWYVYLGREKGSVWYIGRGKCVCEMYVEKRVCDRCMKKIVCVIYVGVINVGKVGVYRERVI